MKTKLKFFAALAVAVALLFATPPPAVAQDAYGAALSQIIKGQNAARAEAGATVAGDVLMLVRYVGTQSGKVASADATGDLTFTQGVSGSEAASTEFECPVSGALGGVIDVSDTACDTLGEVADIINASTSWRAVILDGLRSDSSNNTISVLAATAATSLDGLPLYSDNAVNFTHTQAVLPVEWRSMKAYLQGNTLKTDPFAGVRPVLWLWNWKSTYGSGASTGNIISVRATYNPTTFAGSETATTMYSTASGATTVSASVDFTPFGMFGRRNEKMLVRISNTEAMTSATSAEYGMLIPAN